MSNTFLVEIGTEELPPKSLRLLATAFAKQFTEQLDNANIAHGEVTWYATPRRLALKIFELASKQPDVETVKRGPAVSAAFTADGSPTPAALGWAKGCGITIDQAQRLKTDQGEWLLHQYTQSGHATVDLLPDMVKNALAKLPIPKAMRWGDKRASFIRPIHTLTLLYGDQLIPATVLEIASDRIIQGHRFMGESHITLSHADDYPEILENRGKVIADYERRKAIIKADAEQAAKALKGVADLSDDLLEEVTSLVEWPVVLTAAFDPRFLDVPSEALVYTMKGDQKYFPVYDAEQRLLPHFIFVSNIESKDPNVVIAGNEKVVRPRLSDAEFFYTTDCKTTLISRLPALQNVLFQQQLGTVAEKAERISQLAGSIAELTACSVEEAKRAGLLAKCDLVTNTVFEFPETQGTIGRYLAARDGESEAVVRAIEEQYLPKFSGDRLPSHPVSNAVSLAEKLDTLAGIFGIGQHPKGDKDPFALRRAAIGVLRIIIENKLSLDLMTLAELACAGYGDKLTNSKAIEEIVSFIQGRFRAWYQEKGVAVDTIQSVLTLNPTSPTDIDARIQAVTHFKTLPEAKSLAEANKRVSNILAKTDSLIPEQIQTQLIEAEAEAALAEKITQLHRDLTPAFERGDYREALVALATLKEPVDRFFDEVMVMVEDERIKLNRLAILKQLQTLFLKAADISLLQL